MSNIDQMLTINWEFSSFLCREEEHEYMDASAPPHDVSVESERPAYECEIILMSPNARLASLGYFFSFNFNHSIQQFICDLI